MKIPSSNFSKHPGRIQLVVLGLELLIAAALVLKLRLIFLIEMFI